MCVAWHEVACACSCYWKTLIHEKAIVSREEMVIVAEVLLNAKVVWIYWTEIVLRFCWSFDRMELVFKHR